MKRYILYTLTKALAYTLPLIASLFVIASCSDDDIVSTTTKHNFSMNFATRSAETDQVVNNVQLYTFYNSGSSNDKTFHSKILNLTRNTATSTVSASVQSGLWHMAMVAPPAGVSFIEPTGGVPMAQLPMYKYQPGAFNTSVGRHPNAAEIFFVNDELPEIVANTTTPHSTQLNRNVAMVQVILTKTTANFKLDGTHKITLHHIPSTISYTGKLLRETNTPGQYAVNKNNPDTIHGGISSYIRLKESETFDGFYCDDSNEADPNERGIKFVIPAHRGENFLTNPGQDTTELKMNLTVELERTGGTIFKKTVEIGKVALINHVLRINVTVNDGVLVESEILEWDRVNMNGTVGDAYKNWLYVKKGATGTGASWRDAAPSIGVAITRAQALIAAGETVNGILVAGSDNTYDESLTIPANIRIFGGWDGTTGTELSATDPNAPYTSTDRKLATKKARLNVGTGKVLLNGNNSVFDGFIVSGSASASDAALVTVSNSTARINAVIIDQQTISAPYALSVSNNGIASNILVSQNNKGISVAGNGKLINATVTNNSDDSSVNSGTVYNTIFWPNNPNLSGTNDIQYSAFVGERNTIPSGTGNVHVSLNNTDWFSTTITAPGPHFKLSNALDRYQANNKRAPMLGRANPALFDNNTGFPTGASKDINGNTRYFPNPDNRAENLMDIGCFEEPEDGHAGFLMRWLSEELYLVSKGGYVNRLPLMIPNNEDPDIAIAVDWTATLVSGHETWSTYEGPEQPTGTEPEVVVGYLRFKNFGETPDNDYGESRERTWGYVNITTNLGGYLPNTTLKILQAPGASVNWEDGYVGSFHRNNQVGARYIYGPNTGDWEVRVLSGLDWIKIDGKDMDYGVDVSDPEEGNTPDGSNYKQVEEVWGGVISGNGNIKFRVGMKSKNKTGAPRYGLIIITRTVGGSTGAAMFFVRQGQQADYLYRDVDSRTGGRTNAVKFSPYNIMAVSGMRNNGIDVGSGNNSTAEFTDYPTKVGDYFMWNRTVAYRRGVQTSNLPTLRPNASGMTTMSADPCPPGYRHGTLDEWIESLYQNVAITSYRGVIEPEQDPSALRNFMFGRLADGHYDQLVGSSVTSNTNLVGTNTGDLTDQAVMGILMVNHYNYASVFFPAGEVMYRGRTAWSTANQYDSNKQYALYNCSSRSSYSNDNRWHSAHWCTGHVGMNCSVAAGPSAPSGTSTPGTSGWYRDSNTLVQLTGSHYVHAVPVRCVLDE